jgi:hypothetical protein
MKRRTKIIILVVVLVGASIAGAGIAISAMDDDETEVPITGVEYDQASKAAIDYLGGGVVTDTEKGDEESLYEVEVTLDDGRQIDVQLDENFTVVGTEDDGVGEDED